MEGYGLTEGTCCSTINPFTGPRKIGSIGLPTRGQEVVDPRRGRRRRRPTATPGEVCFRGPNVMQGYYNRPDANAETLRDGWLHTGDVGYRDEDGYFFLVDRKKDMIIRGGENIYPREIEDVLLEHDAVQERRGGRPPGRGPRRGGARRRRAGRRAPTWTRSSAHCRERLAAVQGPVELGGRRRAAQDLDGQDRQEAAAREAALGGPAERRAYAMGILDDKAVLITGAASGIGEATAREARAEGARLLLADVDDEQGEALAGELGGDVYVSLRRHRRGAGRGRSSRPRQRELGGLDGAFNCAGHPRHDRHDRRHATSTAGSASSTST